MISSKNDATTSFALDTQGLGDLKRSAKAGSSDATRGAAQQFEALFINQMMKSMRDATPQDGLTDNQQTKMFTSMLDQQLSQNISKRGMGLADVLVRQLSSQNDAKALAIGGADGASGTNGAASMLDIPLLQKQNGPLKAMDGAGQTNGVSASGRAQAPHVRAFQEKLGAHAAEAEAATGVPAKFMLGQAALETGWGKRMIRNADGSNANNLFGIKAGPGWKGKVATAVTTEYVNGHARQRVESSAPTTRRPIHSRITRACWPTIRATTRCSITPATPPPSPTACSAPAMQPTRSTGPSCRRSSRIHWHKR